MKLPDVHLPKLIRPADGFAFFLGLGSSLLAMLHFFTAPGALEHWDDVKAAAREHYLNPRLVAAIVEAASEGRAAARGADGRCGLMAVRGDRLAMADPAKNLAAGCRELARIAEAIPDRPRLALFAYHEGGRPAATQLMQKLPQLGSAEIIERCAEPGARAFIDRVMAAWERFEPDPHLE